MTGEEAMGRPNPKVATLFNAYDFISTGVTYRKLVNSLR